MPEGKLPLGTLFVNSAPEAVQTSAPADGRFGRSCAIAGELAVVGAVKERAAYIFSRAGGAWTQAARIPAPPGLYGQFGFAVSMHGRTVVVGAPVKDGGGAAFVFVHDKRATGGAGWSLQQVLAPAAGDTKQFGSAVAVYGDTVLIGGDEYVYVFTRVGGTWTRVQKLEPEPEDRKKNSDFGWLSVALDGDTAAVSAFRNGAAYVFRRTSGTWLREARLVAPENRSSEGFGFSVAVSQDRVVVGAIESGHEKVEGPGAAFVYRRSLARRRGLLRTRPWILESQLSAAKGALGDNFGYAVAVSRDRIVVVAVQWDKPGGPGYACVFSRDSAAEALVRSGHAPPNSIWTQTGVLRAPNARPMQFESDGQPNEGDNFGRSLAMGGTSVFVGAPRSRVLWPSVTHGHAGLVYVYEVPRAAQRRTPRQSTATRRKSRTI